MTDSPPGWLEDPSGRHDHRYWDGTRWTEHVGDAGVAGVDPYVEPGDGAPEPEGDADPDGVEEAEVAEEADDAPPPDPIFPLAPPPIPLPAAAYADPPRAFTPPSPKADRGAGADTGGPRRRRVLTIVALVALVGLAIFVLTSGDDGGQDAEAEQQLAAAIENEAGGAVSPAQATCIAELVVGEAGADAFDPADFRLDDPEFLAAILSVGPQTFLDQCAVGEGVFGGSGDDGPETVGDLQAACAEGDLGACDDLYYSAEGGTDLEEFGNTCGGTAEPQQGACEATDGGQREPAEGSGPG